MSQLNAVAFPVNKSATGVIAAALAGVNDAQEKLATIGGLLQLIIQELDRPGSARSLAVQAKRLARAAARELAELDTKILSDTAAIGSSGPGRDAHCCAHFAEKAA